MSTCTVSFISCGLGCREFWPAESLGLADNYVRSVRERLWARTGGDALNSGQGATVQEERRDCVTDKLVADDASQEDGPQYVVRCSNSDSTYL